MFGLCKLHHLPFKKDVGRPNKWFRDPRRWVSGKKKTKRNLQGYRGDAKKETGNGMWADG